MMRSSHGPTSFEFLHMVRKLLGTLRDLRRHQLRHRSMHHNYSLNHCVIFFLACELQLPRFLQRSKSGETEAKTRRPGAQSQESYVSSHPRQGAWDSLEAPGIVMIVSHPRIRPRVTQTPPFSECKSRVANAKADIKSVAQRGVRTHITSGHVSFVADCEQY